MLRSVRTFVAQAMSVESSIQQKLSSAFQPTVLAIRNECVHTDQFVKARTPCRDGRAGRRKWRDSYVVANRLLCRDRVAGFRGQGALMLTDTSGTTPCN